MNKKELRGFIIKARLQTYAGEGGKVEAALSGSTQLEFSDGDWLYREVYYTGKNTFAGLEAVYFQRKPVFSVSYYGNWGEMTEEEIDNILRGALIANPETRLDKKVVWEKDGFMYECLPETEEGIEEVGGTERILKDGKEIYVFYYAGSKLV